MQFRQKFGLTDSRYSCSQDVHVNPLSLTPFEIFYVDRSPIISLTTRLANLIFFHSRLIEAFRPGLPR